MVLRKEPAWLSTSSFSTSGFGVEILKATQQRLYYLPGNLVNTRSICSSNSTVSSLLRLTNTIKLVPSSVALFVPTRCININSKLGKRKTCKAVAKRFLRTGKGKLKRWKSGKNHRMMCKRKKRRRQLRKPTYVNKQQLKLLNKMLNGW